MDDFSPVSFLMSLISQELFDKLVKNLSIERGKLLAATFKFSAIKSRFASDKHLLFITSCCILQVERVEQACLEKPNSAMCNAAKSNRNFLADCFFEQEVLSDRALKTRFLYTSLSLNFRREIRMVLTFK